MTVSRSPPNCKASSSAWSRKPARRRQNLDGTGNRIKPLPCAYGDGSDQSCACSSLPPQANPIRINRMIRNIDAIYDHGILRPVEPLVLPEGARVHLRVEQDNRSQATLADYTNWLNKLAGRWQGDFTHGDEGDFETREPMS